MTSYLQSTTYNVQSTLYLRYIFPPLTKMFHFSGYGPCLTTGWCGFAASSFLIRISPDQRLLRTYPRLFAATPRPSSPFGIKASSICPWVLILLINPKVNPYHYGYTFGQNRGITKCSYFVDNIIQLLKCNFFLSSLRSKLVGSE